MEEIKEEIYERRYTKGDIRKEIEYEAQKVRLYKYDNDACTKVWGCAAFVGNQYINNQYINNALIHYTTSTHKHAHINKQTTNTGIHLHRR